MKQELLKKKNLSPPKEHYLNTLAAHRAVFM